MNIKLDTKTLGQAASIIIVFLAFCIMFPNILSLGQGFLRFIVIISTFLAACFIIYFILTMISKLKNNLRQSQEPNKTAESHKIDQG